jgi:hypothetical protein
MALESESAFSPALRRAINAESHMRASRGFDSQFFARLDEKRNRSRTVRGQIERLFELEVNGVAVWRLLGSSLAGSTLPALVLAFGLIGPPNHTSHPISGPLWAFTPVNQRKFWEEAAWKSPFRSFNITLLDPHFNQGGDSCASPLWA